MVLKERGFEGRRGRHLKLKNSLLVWIEISHCKITMKDFSVFPDVRRYKNWVHKIDS